MVVKQILGLFELNHAWWRQFDVSAPVLEIPQAISLNWSTAMGGHIANIGDFKHAESALRCFFCVIVGDRSGKLTRQLIDDGILDYVLNTIRTDSVKSRVNLALEVLALLFVRNRSTCTLVSRYLPPTVARTLALAYTDSFAQAGSAFSLAAAAAASQVMYPDAHTTSILPNTTINDTLPTGQTCHSADDFEPALIEPSLCSLTTASISAFIYEEDQEKPEFEAEKKRFNLDHRKFLPYCLVSGASQFDANGVLIDALPEDEAYLAITRASQARTDEILQFQAALKAEKQAARLARKPTDTQLDIGDEDAESTSSEDEFTLDDHQRSVLPPSDRLIPRFAAAEEEWHLFLSFDGIACESVLHRGLLKITLSLPDGPESSNGILNGHGHWTIAHGDTFDSITDDASMRSGQYFSTVDQQTTSSNQGPETIANWLEEHMIEFSDATVDMDDGVIDATIISADGSEWILNGTGMGFGYLGSIQAAVTDGQDDIIGGFILVKPEKAHPSAIGKDDLNAFERLAHLSLIVGPLADASNAAYPLQSEDPTRQLCAKFFGNQNLDLGDGLKGSALMSQKFTQTASNSDCFNQITSGFNVVHQDESLIPKLFFAKDSLYEHDSSDWRAARLARTKYYYYVLKLRRNAICLSLRSQIGFELETLNFFALSGDHSQDPGLYWYPSHQQSLQKRVSELMVPENDEAWRTALITHYKWVARFCLFEVAGLPDIFAMQFVIHHLHQFLTILNS